MNNKIKLTQGAFGNWYCEVIGADNIVTKVNDGGINLDREELIIEALKVLGVDVDFVLRNGKVVK